MRGPGREVEPQPRDSGGSSFPVPPFLPDAARTLLPWARRYAARIAHTERLTPRDAWDETIAALIRATVYFQPGHGTFANYAKTAVTRGLHRYLQRPLHRQRRHPLFRTDPHYAPSAEALATLAETARGH